MAIIEPISMSLMPPMIHDYPENSRITEKEMI